MDLFELLSDIRATLGYWTAGEYAAILRIVGKWLSRGADLVGGNRPMASGPAPAGFDESLAELEAVAAQPLAAAGGVWAGLALAAIKMLIELAKLARG